jgi:hypothetical protein
MLYIYVLYAMPNNRYATNNYFFISSDNAAFL